MNREQFDMMVKQMKQSGLNEDQIMKVLYEAFVTNKCSLEDYELMVSWMGYTLSSDFYKHHGINKGRRK